MINCLPSISNVSSAQGPISGDLQQYAQRLAELIQDLPAGNILEARRMLQGIFDGIERLEGLESVAVIGIGRCCRICGITEQRAINRAWWVTDDLCSRCADVGVPQ
jgi:hypothetical protein